MKAAIVELREKKAAALLSNGTVVIIPNRSYALGQEIEYRSPAITARKAAAWAAGVAAVLCIGLGVYAYKAPYSYVSLDINPSIEFSLNRFDQVLRVTAVNTDAQAIVTELYHQDISHRNIAQVVELTIKSLSERRYFEKEGGSYVLIAAASHDTKKVEELVLTLEQTAHLAKDSPEKLRVETVSGKPEQVEEARKAGVTLGKKQLVDELEKNINAPKPFDYDEWLHKPVTEIMEEAEKHDKPKKHEEPNASPIPEPEKTPKPSKGKDPGKSKTPQPSSSNGNKGQDKHPNGNGAKGKPEESEKNGNGGSKPSDQQGKASPQGGGEDGN